MFQALRYYVRVDHRTRFRNNMICVAVATVFYMLCYEEKYPEAFAVKTSLGVLFISFTMSVLLYVFQNRNRASSVPMKELDAATLQLLRRRLLRGMAWIVVLGCAGAGTPLLEAAIVDRRLRKVLHGEPNEEKLAETAQIIAEATKHNLRASPKLIVDAANQFATYRSSLLPLPLKASYLTTLTATPTEPKGPPISVAVGCAKAKAGAEARSGAIFGFAGFTLSDCSDLVIWPTKPEVIRLDTVDSKNATFVNCALIYKGGKLKLENVRFINCTFQVSVAYARNQNVLTLLTAALNGQPINLELAG